MSNISHIPIGIVGFWKIGNDLDKLKIEKNVLRLFIYHNPVFIKPPGYDIFSDVKFIWIDKKVPRGINYYPVISYDTEKINKFLEKEKYTKKKYYLFFDWVAYCQNEIDQYSDQLRAICMKIHSKEFSITYVKKRFVKKRFRIVSFARGNGKWFI